MANPLHYIFTVMLLAQTVSSSITSVLPSSRSQLPSSRSQLPSSRSQLPSSRSQLPSSRGTLQAVRGSRFASHVTVHTPARSYSHGVGDPLPSVGRRVGQPRSPRNGRRQQYPRERGGYPRVRPAVPFDEEERPRGQHQFSAWQNSLQETPISVLPPSPYKVDSPDPESLWPEGLFLPPLTPYVFGRRRADADQLLDSSDPLDPYLLEGSEAVTAVRRAEDHGLYYFHDIPHIESLLANQQLRLENELPPHRLGSIRHTWPYNRP